MFRMMGRVVVGLIVGSVVLVAMIFACSGAISDPDGGIRDVH